jgi:hypothetical protein
MAGGRASQAQARGQAQRTPRDGNLVGLHGSVDLSELAPTLCRDNESLRVDLDGLHRAHVNHQRLVHHRPWLWVCKEKRVVAG